MNTITRTITIYSPTSPRGKVLKNALPDTLFSEWKVKLLDEEELEGTLTEYDGGVELVEKMTMEALLEAGLVFFCDNPARSRDYMRLIREESGQATNRLLIDLSSGIYGNDAAGVVSRQTHSPESLTATHSISLANPLAIGLHQMLELSNALSPLESISAMALVPVSEFGNSGIEALHEQIVELMNFSDSTESVFGNQLVFNMIPGYGHTGSRLSASEYESRIASQIAHLSNGNLPPISLTSALVPAFYSFAVNLNLYFKEPVDANRFASGLSHGDGMQMELDDVTEDQPFDGPLAISDSRDIQITRCVPSPTDERLLQLLVQFDNVNTTAVQHALSIAESYFSHS